jgi:muramoyltetrapeptide carboxypeptidase
VAGLALGRFTEASDDGAHPVADVLAELAERLAVPAVADFPFGHVEHNWTLPVGCLARLDADAATLALTEPAVRAEG